MSQQKPHSTRLLYLLGSIFLLSCFSAIAVLRDGGIDPANLGKGDYIYYMNAATNKLGGNVPSVTSTTTLMQYYKSIGVRYIMVKAATGDKLFNGSYASPQFTSNLCNIARSNGILIFGYNRSDGSNVVGEIAVADYVFNQGADGFVFDAEVEWEAGASHPWITNASAQAWALCSAVRSNWPTKFLAHSPLPIIYFHSSFPYKEFGYWCDAVLPQVYHFSGTSWPGLKGSMSASINWSDVNWRTWQNSLVGTSSNINGQTIYWTNAIKPLALVNDVYGPLYSSPLPDRDVMEFIDFAQATPTPVTAGGYKGVNFWRADLHGSVQFSHIKAGTSGDFSNVVNNIVIDDANASRVGTWTAVKTFSATTTLPSFTGNGSGTDTNSFGTNYYTKAQGSGTAYMQFTPNVLVAGDYNIYQWHPNRADASTNLPFVISYYGGTATNYANQTTNSGNWTLVGRYPFAPGNSGTIRVYDNFSDPASVALVDGLKMVFVAPTTAPTAPSSLVATAVSGSQINLTWNDNSTNEASFLISQSTVSGGPFTEIATVAPNKTSHSVTGLNADTTYYFVVKATNYFGGSTNSVQASTKTFAVGGSAPGITQQPQNQTINVGSNATFSVTATGTAPVGYQWRFNAASISGATLSTYTRTNIQTSDGGNYSVVITNAYGTLTSSNAILTVNVVAPSITAQPQHTTNNAGTTATFTVAATGSAPLAYQWKKNGSVLNDGGNVTGATTLTLTLTSVAAADAADYSVTITNSAGTVTSSNAVLTVNSVPSITSQPVSQTNNAGSVAVFTVTATGSQPLVYQWKKNGTNLTNAGNISGVTTSSLTLGTISQNDAANYTVSVTNSFGTALSSAAALIVIDPPAITSQPASRTNNAGTLATFTVVATGTSPSFKWLKNGSALVNGGNISGANTAVLNLASVAQIDAADYSVIVSNSANSVTSSIAVLTVITAPSITAQPQNQTVSAGANVTFNVSATGSAPLSYRWRYNGTTISGATNSFYTKNSVQTNDAGNYSVVITNLAGSVTSSNAVLTINAGLTQIVTVSNIWNITAGTRDYITTGNTERGIAINTASNHVLIVSRATNANGIIAAVNASSGADLNLRLNTPTNIINGGTLALNKVVVTSNGIVYAVNLTTASGSSPLRIYRWANYSDIPVVVYSGAPDSGTTARWGDTVAIRGSGTGTQIIIAGSASTNAAIFTTSNGTNFTPTIVTPSPAIVGGALSKGLSFGSGNTFYMKNRNFTTATNYLFNLGTGVATVNATLPGFDANIIAIGVDTEHQIMAGVFDDNTTNAATHLLKAYDISNSGSPNLIGSFNFPTFGSGTNSSNSNLGAHVDTDGNKIVGLDTQNGVIALQIYTQTSPAIITQPLDQSAPQGQTVIFSVAASGTAPLSYQWKKNGTNLIDTGAVSGTSTANLTLSSVSVSDEADYTVLVNNPLGTAESAPATLAVIVAPSVLTQPNATTVNAGGSASFSVTAAGTEPLSYQWKKGTIPLTNSANIFGATSTELVLANISQSDAGDYTVTITNAAGATNSLSAHLTVIDPPTITGNPTATTAAAGSTAIFTGTATGSNLGYQWRKNGITLPNGGNISGATTANLTITTASQADVADYSLHVTNSAGNATSTSAHLNVIDAPVIGSQPVNRTNNINTTATFSVTASGQAIAYRWKKNGTDLTNGGNVSGATSATLTLLNVTQLDVADYSVNLTNIAGSQTSSNAHLTVIIPPVITSQPQNVTNSPGTTALFTVAASSASPLTYVWKKNNTTLTDNSTFSGTTNATLSVANVSPSEDADYSVLVSNSAGATNSSAAHLTVTTAPEIMVQPVSQITGAGTNIVFSVSVTGSAPLVYQWKKDNTNLLNSAHIVGANLANLTIAGATISDEGAYSVLITNSAGSTSSEDATLTLVSLPAISLQPISQTNASGPTLYLTVAAIGENLTYQWQKNASELSDDATDSGRVFGSKTDTLTILNSDPSDSGLYRVIAMNEAGAATSQSATVAILHAPEILTQPQSRTNGANTVATFTVTTAGSSLVYQWNKNGTSLVNNLQISGANTATLTIKSLTSVNNGDYSLTVSNAVGSATSSAAHLQVLAIPSITAQPANRTNVTGTTATFSVTASGVGLQYRWKKAGVFISDNYYISGSSSPSLTLSGVLPGDSASYAVVVSNAVGSVTSKSATLKVFAPPVITSQPRSSTNATGGTARFSVICSGTTPISYRWKKDGTPLANGGGISGATATTLVLSEISQSSAGTYSVEITNYAGTAISATATLTIIDAVTILSQPQNATNITGTTATLTVVASGTNPQYQWRKGSIPLTNNANISGARSDTLQIENLQLTNAGIYSVIVSNYAGKTVSTNAFLTVLSPPTFQSQPADQPVVYSSNAVFAVTVGGTGPFGFQWKKNGTNLINTSHVVGATSSSLTVVGALPGDEGSYSVEVTNVVSSVSSSPAVLTIVPGLLISKPTANAIVALGVTNVFGTASDQAGLTQVQYSWNGAPFVTAIGTTNWTTPILNLLAGTNVIAVKSINTGGRESKVVTRSFFYPVLGQLTLITNGIGSVTPNLPAQLLYVGRNYSMAAIPGTGQLFSNWTGTYSTNFKTLTFRMQSNVTVQVNFVTNLFLSRTGTYTGLLYETNVITHESSGLFKLVLASAGSYSGQFYVAGTRRTMSGQFNLSGKSTFVYNGDPSITFDLDLGTTNGITDRVTGTASNANWTAELSGDRSVYDANNSSPRSGTYLLALAGSNDGATAPGGDGIATLLVNSNGVTTLSGTLADGTLISQSAVISKNGQIPLYVPLYGGKGSLLGWLTITNRLTSGVEGDVSWIKKNGTTTLTYYANGFTNDLITAGSLLSSLTNDTPGISLTNGVAILSGGDLSQSITNTVNLSIANVLTVDAGQPDNLTLSLNINTGVISGSFFDRNSGAKVPVKGVLLQQQNTARGYFLSSPNHVSGSFLINSN